MKQQYSFLAIQTIAFGVTKDIHSHLFRHAIWSRTVLYGFSGFCQQTRKAASRGSNSPRGTRQKLRSF